MIGLMAWLAFGNDVLLSANTMQVTPQCVWISPKEALAVKGPGAAIVVNLSYDPQDRWPEGVMSRLDRIAQEYPSGRVTAKLYRAGGTTVSVTNEGKSAGDAEFQLFLAPPHGFAKDDEFVRISVCADPAIRDARLSWRRIGK